MLWGTSEVVHMHGLSNDVLCYLGMNGKSSNGTRAVLTQALAIRLGIASLCISYLFA